MKTIGIVGLGLVGTAIAERLIQHSYDVVGFDIDARRTDDLARLGGRPLACAASVSEECDGCLLSLPTSDIVVQVLPEMSPALVGKMVIDTTTGDPDTCAHTGQRLAAEGIHYVDATIVGSSRHVREGIVTVLAGGEEQDFRACLPVMQTFSKECLYLGTWGNGARMKLVVNLVIGLHRAVLAEGLFFAKSSGIDPSLALQVMQGSLAYSRIMDTKGRKMIDRDFSVEAKLSQHHKDVRLMLETARRAGVQLPLTELHSDLLSSAEAMGLGDADNSAIIETYRSQDPP